jgi:tetratricopeptide (TPR) repeat protein
LSAVIARRRSSHFKEAFATLNFFMGRKGFWIATLGIVFGFAGGFFFANLLNRQQTDSLKAKAAQSQTSQTSQVPQAGQKMELGDSSPVEGELSPEEIQKKIKQADDNPANTQFQKDLGLSLYLYAGMKKDAALLLDAKRLMTRAVEKNPRDYDLLVALGNVNFDLGQNNKENSSLEEARAFYRKALELKPKQVDLQTDLGSTYFLSDPPEYEKAMVEYRKSLQMDPEHVRTLDNLSRTLIMTGQIKEAEESLAKLKKLDANYPGVASLETLLAQKREAK